MGINILQLTLSFRQGGRRNAIKALSRGLNDTGTQCDLCCLDDLGCDRDEVSDLFRTVTVLGRQQAGYRVLARRLHALCRDQGVDLIHAHDAASQFIGSLVRLVRPRVRLVMTFHRSLGFESARRRDRLRNAAAGWLTQAVVTGSTERRSHFLSENHVPPRKVVVIPFGIDTEAFRPDTRSREEIRAKLGLRGETVVVGAVGHFGPEKGIDRAIEAFGEFRRRAPGADAVLVVLGDGTPGQREAVMRLADGVPGGRVVLAGFQPDPRRWYAAFDVLLHTPRLEAFGLVVIEAMSARLPVVATRVGGVPEIVRDGQTGLLADPDSVGGLADQLARLVLDGSLRERLAERGREVASEEYSLARFAGRYLDLYQRVLAHRATPAGRATGAPQPLSMAETPFRE